MRKPNEPFIPDHFYHVYNRAVGSEKMFKEATNYIYYLNKIQKHILPIADIFCYALLPNHFHLFVQIKSEQEVKEVFLANKAKHLQEKYDSNHAMFIVEQFGNCCNAYTKAFNKKYNRKGKLFMDNLNRKEITSADYYTKIIHYIHANAVQHGLCKRIEDWGFSSYNSILQNNCNWLQTEKTFDWFGNKEAFIKFHQQPVFLKMKKE